jgi:hypothetical protein
MMNKVRTIFSALCFCLLASVALSVAAQSAGYTKLNVKGRVQLEVPSDWTISDAEQRRRVKEFAEKVTGVATEHVASLSAQSYPAPSRVFVRVSFIPMEPPLTQADVRQGSGQQAAGAQGLGGRVARGVPNDVGGHGEVRHEGSWTPELCRRTNWRPDRPDHSLRTHIVGQLGRDDAGDSIPCAAGR